MLVVDECQVCDAALEETMNLLEHGLSRLLDQELDDADFERVLNNLGVMAIEGTQRHKYRIWSGDSQDRHAVGTQKSIRHHDQ